MLLSDEQISARTIVLDGTNKGRYPDCTRLSKAESFWDGDSELGVHEELLHSAQLLLTILITYIFLECGIPGRPESGAAANSISLLEVFP